MANVDNNVDEYLLSDDGKTLTMKTTYLVPKRTEQTLTFSRVSGGPGLFGVWKMEGMQNDAYEFSLTSADSSHVTVTWPTMGGTSAMPIDGKDAPVKGAPEAVPATMTAAFKPTGARTFDLTLKLDGQTISLGHCTVSPDQKTLTMDAVSAPGTPQEEHVTLIFERQ